MRVSIITPCYNLKDYIKDTYDAICNQTMRDWEWIIVDDQSTDNTISIIESFNDSRIKLICSAHVGNLSILRNKGAAIARGEFLAFVDGDDLCEPDKLTLQLKQFDQYPATGWNHTSIKILIEETGKLEDRKDPATDAPFVESEHAFSLLTYRNFVCVSTVMVRKAVFEAVGGFDEKFHRCEDINLWLRLTASGYHMGYVKQHLLKYRVRLSGLYVSKTLEYLRTNFQVYDDIKAKFPDLTLRHMSSINKHLSDINLKIAIRLLNQGSGDYRDYFKKAFMLTPSLKKTGWLVLSYCFPGRLRSYVKTRLI